MTKKLLTISETAARLGVSLDTLRRWDKAGTLKAVRLSPGGNRYYNPIEVELKLKNLFSFAKTWVLNPLPVELDPQFYCIDTSVFQARLHRFEQELKATKGLEGEFTLISSVVGEIGNNSFDHNIGAWPDIRGILFAYDIKQRMIVLADRGRGILETLKRARPSLSGDEEALHVAFTEKLTGRTPENRGNGLKYVRNVVTDKNKKIAMELSFQSGTASLDLMNGDTDLTIIRSEDVIKGCLALISFEIA